MTTSPILIMGAHGGTGQALMQRRQEQKLTTLITCRTQDNLDGLLDTSTEGIACDVMSDDIDQKLGELTENTDHLSGFVYAIGDIPLAPLDKVTPKQLQNTLTLHVTGAIQAIQALQNKLVAGAKETGSPSGIVLFSSVAAQHGFVHHAVISAIKGAIEGLTHALAAELAPHIRVNAIAPSLSDTPIAQSMTANDTLAKSLAKDHPLQRLGTPDDLASAAAFLADGAQSGWITGQVLGVDGGRAAVAGK